MTRPFTPILHRLRSKRGLASALIIMLLVLLVFFGILSLVTTAADLRLSQKRASWNSEYYQADANAVRVFASLEQYCAGLDAASLQPEQLKALLGSWLDGAGLVQTWQIVSDDETGTALTLNALIARDAEKGQGIAMRLRILTGKLPVGMDRFVIEGWSQWQPEFDYSGTEGGIWKG